MCVSVYMHLCVCLSAIQCCSNSGCRLRMAFPLYLTLWDGAFYHICHTVIGIFLAAVSHRFVFRSRSQFNWHGSWWNLQLCGYRRIIMLQLKHFLRKMMTSHWVVRRELAHLQCQNLCLILFHLQEVRFLRLLPQCGHKTYSIDLVIRYVRLSASFNFYTSARPNGPQRHYVIRLSVHPSFWLLICSSVHSIRYHTRDYDIFDANLDKLSTGQGMKKINFWTHVAEDRFRGLVKAWPSLVN